MEEIEQINSDAQTEVSSEPQKESEQQTATQESGSQGSQQTQSDTTDKTPFHEHPRFKELVEQKNQFHEESTKLKQQVEQMQQYLQYMAMQQQKTGAKPETKDELIERLKGIDPDFGARFEELNALKNEVQEMREWRNQYTAEAGRQQTESSIESLHSEYKVSDQYKGLYRSMIAEMANKDRRLTAKDLPKVYKSVHEQISGIIDGIKRSERESYLTSKKTDSSKPTTQTKGKIPGGKTDEFSSNPEDARAQIVRRVMNKVREEQSL